MRAACRGIAALAAAWLVLGVPGAEADIVELTTGRRIEGTVKEATAAAVVIDVGGREVRVHPLLVRSISFDAGRRAPPAPPATAAAPPPAAPPPRPALPPGIVTALSALERLQAATASPMGVTAYGELVEDVRREVTSALGNAASDHAGARDAIQAAIRYHAFAAFAAAVFEARGDLASVGRDPVIRECPPLAARIARDAERFKLDPADPVVAGLIVASEGAAPLRACASAKITEAETRARAGR